MRELLRFGTLSLLTVTLSTPALYAQVSFATVQGSVTDEGGAAIAGAIVTVTNSRTGVVTTLKTNSRGFYNFAELQIGGAVYRQHQCSRV